ncbi:MAG TPA: ferric reductase-like transmembrane domain-containing protein [Candidatus Limnocylindria bacterium]|nr:ferric reductase-like transmembrane domain-containing protein [Candidatus Limnocylindria bacterium]
MALTAAHTLTWEVARVGGMVAYVLATASVVLGLLLSLGVRSPRWPRFITNELHRFLSVLTVTFVAIHTAAVFIDPFTAFTPAEVLVPFAAHYRPLWIALGIVSGYLAIAVWASEYVRSRIGYAWWRRFHYLAFAVFALGALHGVGTGSDTREWWGLATYGVTIGAVVLLVGWRLLRALDPGWRDAAVGALAIVHAAAAIFILVGPAQAGWNDVANNGNGNGASAAWLAAQASTATAAAHAESPASFSATLPAAIPGEDAVTWTFTVNGESGRVRLRIDDEAASLTVALSSGWSCRGTVSQAASDALVAACQPSTGAFVDVRLENLRRVAGGITGVLDVTAA